MPSVGYLLFQANETASTLGQGHVLCILHEEAGCDPDFRASKTCFCPIPGLLFLGKEPGVLEARVLFCSPETLSQPPWVILPLKSRSGQ